MSEMIHILQCQISSTSASQMYFLKTEQPACVHTDKQIQNSVAVHAHKCLCTIQAIVFEKVSLHVSSVLTQQVLNAGSTKIDLQPQVSYPAGKVL